MNYSQDFAQIPTKDLWWKIKIFCRHTLLKRGIFFFQGSRGSQFSSLKQRIMTHMKQPRAIPVID